MICEPYASLIQALAVGASDAEVEVAVNELSRAGEQIAAADFRAAGQDVVEGVPNDDVARSPRPPGGEVVNRPASTRVMTDDGQLRTPDAPPALEEMDPHNEGFLYLNVACREAGEL